MKKYLKIFLCFLLSVITVFSSLPSPALAADGSTTITDVVTVKTGRYRASSGSVNTLSWQLPVSADISDMEVFSSANSAYWSDFQYFSFTTTSYASEGEGTLCYNVKLSTSISVPDISKYITAKIYVNDKLIDSSTVISVDGKNVTVNVKSSDYYTNANAYVNIYITNPLYRKSDYAYNACQIYLKSNSLIPFYNTKSDNFFDNIFDFLADRLDSLYNSLGKVGDKLTELPNVINQVIQNVINHFNDITDSIKNNISVMTDNINGFFISLKNHLSDLVVKIKGFFIDLGNQITAFAMSVKEWFADLFSKLGDWFASVGQWFKDLWTNISDKVIEIKTDIKEWFESLFVVGDNFWSEYRDNFNAFMAEHFGFLYQSMDIISTILTKFKEVLTGNGSGSIRIPKVAIPAKVLGQEYVIVKSRSYIIKSTIQFDDTGKLDYILTTLRVINSALIIMLLINRGRKLFDMIITQGEGVEE